MALRDPIAEYLDAEIARILATITAANGYRTTLQRIYNDTVLPPEEAGDNDFPYACYTIATEDLSEATHQQITRDYNYQIVVFVVERKNGVDVRQQINNVKADIEKAFVDERATSKTNLANNTSGDARLSMYKIPHSEQNIYYKTNKAWVDMTVTAVITYPNGCP